MTAVREWWRTSSRGLRAAWLVILQASLAAMIAWSISHHLLGRPSPIIAPLTAMSAIGVSLDRRLRPSIEMVLGVAVGILVADTFIAWAGRGTWQIGLVVALAMVGGVLVRGGPVVMLQASSTAVVIATVLPTQSSTQFAWERFTDSLIGGTVGLAVTLVLPTDPLREVSRVGTPMLSGLADMLTRLSSSLRERDPALASAALAQAAGLQVEVEQLARTTDASNEVASLAPARWSTREVLSTIETALPHVEAAVRDSRVLARQTHTALQRGDAIPPGLDDAMDECAVAVLELQRSVTQRRGLDDARAASIRAAEKATAAVEHTSGMLAQTVAGQVRAVATDILYATGLTGEDVEDRLPGLPVPVSRRLFRQDVPQPPDSDQYSLGIRPND